MADRQKAHGDPDETAPVRISTAVDPGGITRVSGGTHGQATGVIPGSATAGFKGITELFTRFFWIDGNGKLHVLQTGKLVVWP